MLITVCPVCEEKTKQFTTHTYLLERHVRRSKKCNLCQAQYHTNESIHPESYYSGILHQLTELEKAGFTFDLLPNNSRLFFVAIQFIKFIYLESEKKLAETNNFHKSFFSPDIYIGSPRRQNKINSIKLVWDGSHFLETYSKAKAKNLNPKELELTVNQWVSITVSVKLKTATAALLDMKSTNIPAYFLDLEGNSAIVRNNLQLFIADWFSDFSKYWDLL